MHPFVLRCSPAHSLCLPPSCRVQPIDRLTFQLIPTKLGVESYRVAGCTPPTAFTYDGKTYDIAAVISQADSLLNGRYLADTSSSNYGKCTTGCTGSPKPDCCTALGAGDVDSLVPVLDAFNAHTRPNGSKGCG